MLFGKEDGLPGEIYATNLTPDKATGLGSWTDGEILRAMREGVDKDGNALFPIMPYNNYRQLTEEDAQAIVAYLRTIPAIEHKVPERKLDFPLNVIVNLMPKPMDGPAPAAPQDQLARGKYLFTAASCADCHTPQTSKGPDLTRAGAGGMVFHAGPLSYPAPNITQDKDTGIGSWTDTQLQVALTQGLRPDGKGLRPAIEEYRAQLGGEGVIVLVGVNEGKAAVAIASTTARFSAAELIRTAVVAMGGQGGGGKPDFAQGGAPDGSQAQAGVDAVKAALGA